MHQIEDMDVLLVLFAVSMCGVIFVSFLVNIIWIFCDLDTPMSIPCMETVTLYLYEDEEDITHRVCCIFVKIMSSANKNWLLRKGRPAVGL